jgi:ATP-dependent Lon protease
MGTISRSEMEIYRKVKERLMLCDKEIQTEVLPLPPCDYKYDEEEYEEEYEEYEEYEEAPKSMNKYTRVDKQYYKSLSRKKRKRIDTIEYDITKVNRVEVPLRFKILESEMDIKIKALAISKVDIMSRMDGSSSEYYKMYNWIENLVKLPIGKYKNLPVGKDVAEVCSFLDITRSKLDEVVYGHKNAKDQIVRLLAKWISNPQSKGLVIGIEGVHGIGKTSLVKDGICKVLGLPFGFVPLGGISDGSFLVGHSYTYEGSRWGKIADILMKVGCMNPVLYFDELDKVSGSRYGEEVINILIHMTDSTQNDRVHDKYFTDLELDLSRSLIIFSYNNPAFVNPILKDRMVTIKANGYSTKDKICIAKDYMLPKIFEEFGFNPGDVIFEKDIISYIIQQTDEEQGVRNLKRSLEEIVSHINLHKLLNKDFFDESRSLELPITVTQKIVDMYIKRVDNVNHSTKMMYL